MEAAGAGAYDARMPRSRLSRSGYASLLPLVLLLAAPMLGGCAFDRNWRRMVREQAAAAPSAETGDALAGRWEGKWVSEKSGHTGSLRAIITPVDETRYHVDFDAMFFAVLRAGYAVDLSATQDAKGVTSFRGEKDLGGLAGGVYRYAGTADGQSFNATYESGADNGRFEMKRPKR